MKPSSNLYSQTVVTVNAGLILESSKSSIGTTVYPVTAETPKNYMVGTVIVFLAACIFLFTYYKSKKVNK